MSHQKPKKRPTQCEGCRHAPHPKGVCTITTMRSGNRGIQCGCAQGMVHNIPGKPHYRPA